jgi:hypothetical protein
LPPTLWSLLRSGLRRSRSFYPKSCFQYPQSLSSDQTPSSVISPSRCTVAVAALPALVEAATCVSENVFHSPHSGQRPCQRGL